MTSKLLVGMLEAGSALSLLFPTPRQLKRRAYYGQWNNYASFRSTVYYLYRKGWIRFVDKNSQRFIKLTKHGELEALLAKAKHPKPEAWDGKWRVFIFDIPEESRGKRDFLRYLLKANDFIKLQDSVYVSPYPFGREAIRYLAETGLSHYIRVMKVEEMDDDKDLRKKFNLP